MQIHSRRYQVIIWTVLLSGELKIFVDEKVCYRSIQQAGEHSSCTEILLSEWGTSGKERPTVRTLHKFLLKAQLIRAADYVSEKLLNGLFYHILLFHPV